MGYRIIGRKFNGPLQRGFVERTFWQSPMHYPTKSAAQKDLDQWLKNPQNSPLHKLEDEQWDNHCFVVKKV